MAPGSVIVGRWVRTIPATRKGWRPDLELEDGHGDRVRVEHSEAVAAALSADGVEPGHLVRLLVVRALPSGAYRCVYLGGVLERVRELSPDELSEAVKASSEYRDLGDRLHDRGWALVARTRKRWALAGGGFGLACFVFGLLL